ncbi:MAG TPA: nucleotide exchange factor GrpE [Dongiaceae bacterium]|jgi:molecular chaperone GrpE|nr:nucleotide exchange factor GrpE [Dongiaceae bacterium]
MMKPDKAKQETEAPAPAPAAEAAAVTPAQIEELKAKAATAAENWDRYLRVTADLENYKKRAARERQDAVKFANESLLQKLLTVLDNFDMALAAAQTSQTETLESLQAGIGMIQQQLKSTLMEFGLEEINAAGQPFDPNFHEAVSQQETVDQPEGQVVTQLRKGYKFRDRLLRPASVVVAKKPAA